MTLRILVLESGTEIGGAQSALLTLLAAFDRSEVDPVFVTLGFGNGDMPSRVAELGIPVVALPFARFRRPIETVARIRTLARFIDRGGFHAVLCNSGHPLLFGRPASRLASRPCVWWVHGYFPEDPLKGHAIALAERTLGADMMLANSEFTAAMLRRVFPEHGGIRVLRPPVDTAAFAPNQSNGHGLRAALGINKETPIIGHFGRLHPFKGQHVFLLAARELVMARIPCHFVLVGGAPYGLAPEYSASLRALVTHEGLSDSVTFLGAREDVSELMNACDVVVHSSVEPEPWGLVIAEAMSAGRPVVAARGGGPSEMIKDGVNGRLVEPNDPRQLAIAIQSLLADPLARSRLGNAARETALANWTVAVTARHALRCLEALVSR